MANNEEYINKDLFDQDVRGFLFFSEVTKEGIEKYKLIFEYNTKVLVKLREGDIVAVESFSTLAKENEEKVYSLLEIIRVNPTHITIDRLKKFKFMGAAREFLKEATKDFEEDDPRLIRDHVYVEVDAVPTAYVMRVSDPANSEFDMEPTKPILGRDAALLKAPEVIEKLINKGVEEGISIGKLYATYEEKKKVDVKVNPRKMITHHYSVFGFTGHGKSNLNSILISKLLKERRLKTIVFDISDEYTDLLIDKIEENGYIVIDEGDVSDSVLEYLSKKQNLELAAEDLAKNSKKPGIFDSKEFIPTYKEMFRKLLEDDRVKILNSQLFDTGNQIITMQDLLDELEKRATSDSDRRYYQNMVDLLPKVAENMKIEFNPDYNEWKLDDIEDLEGLLHNLRDAVITKIRYSKEKHEIPDYIIGLDWIIENFVIESGGENICIIVSTHKPVMISLIIDIIELSLRARRRRTRSHDVLFLIDEGHEFVVGKEGKGEERKSSEVIERLTRMGRKYGLGVCISSQRVAYLNTTALSNCHTTFIGALPREYDRKTVNEAYGTVSYTHLTLPTKA